MNAPTLHANNTDTDHWWIGVNHCVHVVDDDPRFLEVLGHTFEAAQIRSEGYLSAEHFLALYASHDADCILLDLRMPGMDGLGLLASLRENHVTPPILMLSAYTNTPEIVQAIKSGADDYLLKPINEIELITKVTKALARNWNEKREHAELFRRLQSLSAREREVMKLFTAAKTTTQIARQLGISPKTVEKHRLRIFEKLNVDSVPALICLLCEMPT